MNFSIHQRLEQIILLVKHFFIYFLYIISIKINVKRLIDFLIATILCNLSFAEYSDYLENSTNFSPLECGIISNVEHFFTREYFEFAKMYNTRDKKTAIADFRKLLNNARTPEACAWAKLGLLRLGEIDKKILEEEITVRYFDATISPKTRKIRLTDFYRRNDVKIPKQYADFNESDFDIPSDKIAYAKTILKKTDMYASFGIFESGVIPAELWAINIITADTNLNKIKENIDFIWHASENFSGKLYALNMLKKIGSEAEFKKRFDSLDKNIKFTRISGCIIDNNTTLATIKNEYIFNIKQSYNRHYLKFPNMPYPRNKNGRPFLLNKPNIVFHETNIEETKLDFLPMRFVTNGDGLLHGEGLEKLAAEWLDEENPHTRESLESLLRFLPQNANRMLAYYSSNVAVFAVKENNTYRFTKIENPKIGSEPCFDEQYLSATPCRKLAQKIFDILARREFSNPKIKNFDTPFHFLFLKANMVAEEIAFPQNRLTKDFIATIKSKLKENSATPIKICAALSKFGADNNPSLWIFPIYADSLKEKLDTIKNRHIEILNSLSEQELKSYSDFVAEKKISTILDL